MPHLISVIGLWSREEGVKTKLQYINRKCTLYVMTMIYMMSTILYKIMLIIMKVEENRLNHITIDIPTCIKSRKLMGTLNKRNIYVP